MNMLIRIAAASLLLWSTNASAAWYTGTVTTVAVGYDGTTVMLALSGWSRTDCTCYSTWPTYACLGRTRASFREEYAMLLAARARGSVLNMHIDEVTCNVIALYENGSP